MVLLFSLYIYIKNLKIFLSETTELIYLVVKKNRTRRHATYKNDNFGFFFLLLELSPLLVIEFDFLSLLYNTNTLRNILMMLGTNKEQDEMHCWVQE